MNEILRVLLNRLEVIGQTHRELYDSDVRQAIRNAVMNGFVRAISVAAGTTDFGMFTAEANLAVAGAVASYIDAANAEAATLGVSRFHERMALLQDPNVRSEHGLDYEEFIGHSPPELYDEMGNVIRNR